MLINIESGSDHFKNETTMRSGIFFGAVFVFLTIIHRPVFI
jgi:hypothetical protein